MLAILLEKYYVRICFNLPALMNRAIAGQADAQFEVAVLYMQSDFNEDIELAEQWVPKGAANGHIEAMYWLGEGYTVYAKELRESDPEESKPTLNMHTIGSNKLPSKSMLPQF